MLSLNDKDIDALRRYPFWFIPIPRTGSKTVRMQLASASVLHVHSGSMHGHLTVADYRNYFGDELLGSLYTFAFVRNPWDRAASWWHKKGKCSEFSEFLQTEQRCDWRWNCLDYLDDTVDFVGRFENLQEDFDKVCGNINMPNVVLPHLNSSNRGHYSEYYDDETRELVGNLCARDIERFGYTYEGSGKRTPSS